MIVPKAGCGRDARAASNEVGSRERKRPQTSEVDSQPAPSNGLKREVPSQNLDSGFAFLSRLGKGSHCCDPSEKRQREDDQ